MWQFFREMWHHTLGRAENPVYLREREGWSYTPLFVQIRRGCLPLILVMLVMMLGCCTLTFLPLTIETPEVLFASGYLLLFALYITGELVLLLGGLLATALTATTVSAEIEAQTYSALRMTPLRGRDIILAKFGAAIYQLQLPTFFTVFTRLGSIVGVLAYSFGLVVGFLLLELPTIQSAATTPNFTTPAPALSLPPIATVLLSSASAVLLIVSVVIWLIYFVVQPFIRVGLFSALGMLASAYAKTRANGLITAVFFRGGYAMVSYVLGQLVSTFISLLTLPLSLLPAFMPNIEQFIIAQTTLFILITVIGSLLAALLGIILQVGVTGGMLAMASSRASKLPYANS